MSSWSTMKKITVPIIDSGCWRGQSSACWASMAMGGRVSIIVLRHHSPSEIADVLTRQSIEGSFVAFRGEDQTTLIIVNKLGRYRLGGINWFWNSTLLKYESSKLTDVLLLDVSTSVHTVVQLSYQQFGYLDLLIYSKNKTHGQVLNSRRVDPHCSLRTTYQ